MDKQILDYIRDMHDFIGNKHWQGFLAGMEERGFTNEQVDELSEELSELLY